MAGDNGLTRRDALRLIGAGLIGAGLSGCDGDDPIAGTKAGDRISMDTDDSLLFASAAAIARAIREREVSSTELTRAYLQRIEATAGELNAVVFVAAEQALAAASAADAALAKDGPVGPLHGVPMTLKDSIDTAGLVTTWGTTGRRDFVPARDATVTGRLKAAGAVLLGKTNTPEFTLSYETDNLIFGRTKNPYDHSRSPGGSSGGAAVAVATGLCAFDVGSDTGGSVRVPSHCCGTAGLKPSQGRVPRTGHAIDYGGIHDGLTQLGPIARSVDDLELILRVIAGPDGRDPSAAPAPFGDPGDVSLPGLRVVWHGDNGLYTPTPEIQAATAAAAASLAEAGARVEERVPEPMPASAEQLLGLFVWNADGGEWIRRLLDGAGTDTPYPAVAQQINPSLKVDSAEIVRLMEARDRFRAGMQSYMINVDAIVSPVVGFAAPPFGETEDDAHFPGYSYTQVYNLAGLPAGVVRCATSPEGLPIGVQVAAAPWREDVVLAVLRHLERAFGGWQAIPSSSTA